MPWLGTGILVHPPSRTTERRPRLDSVSSLPTVSARRSVVYGLGRSSSTASGCRRSARNTQGEAADALAPLREREGMGDLRDDMSISCSPITMMARAARSGRGCPSVADQRSEGAQPTTDRSPGSGPGRPRADPSSGPARALTQWRSSRLATPRRLALFPSPVSPGPDGR